MSIRVHELAKELKITSRELIEKLKTLKVEVKGHMSSLDDETAQIVKIELQPKVQGKSKEKVEAKVETKTEVKAKTKPETKVETKTEVKTKIKTETKPETKPAIKEEIKVPEKIIIEKELRFKFPVSVKDLADKLSVKPNDLIKKLIKHNIFATINQLLDEKTACLIGKEFAAVIKPLPTEEEEILEVHKKKDDPSALVPRAPIVTFMGHVDHGKTSLLDAIRKTNITEREAGGITQHIGAYEVNTVKGRITFLDTPGHEAFTAMRARGANATDIVVLVVAADDGVMPQTIEAIDHAREANVPIVVALNKIDKPNADMDRIRRQLAELNLASEDWGGKTITVGVSAKTKEGIDHLLEMLLLEAEMLELKANPARPANGVVIEAEISKSGGPIATVIVQTGTLRVGEVIMCGSHWGKIKAMIDDKGHRVQEAPPSKPVEILGLSGVVQAGETFYVVEDEKKAREIAASKQEKIRAQVAGPIKRITLEELYQQIKEGRIKELKLILKADVQGSVEAIKDSLLKIPSGEVQLKIIHLGVGDINESDIMLAAASNAIIIGFHVQMTSAAEVKAREEDVEVRLYRVIYEAISEVKAAMEGLLEPHIKETSLGRAEVKQIFKVSNVGLVAGCSVIKGVIARNIPVRVLRNNAEVFKGKISSLKHLKDDVREVKENFECGIGIAEFKDIKVGDIIESYTIEKIAKKLE
ncbi:MAG: translation initiation factor IF-2 [Candidatus Omnitrophota bacterium]